jgi:hypothetical protein
MNYMQIGPFRFFGTAQLYFIEVKY